MGTSYKQLNMCERSVIDRLLGNSRLVQVYRTWDRMSAEKQAAYRESAAAILRALG